MQLSSQLACPVCCSVGSRATPICLLFRIFCFVLFAVGILLPSAAANAMATSTAANSVMCSGPIVSSSSEPSSSSTVALCSCLRKSTDARTASANRTTFSNTVATQGGQVGEALVRKAAGAKAGLQLQCDLLQHLLKLCVIVKFVLGPVSVVYVLVRTHRQPCVLVCMRL